MPKMKKAAKKTVVKKAVKRTVKKVKVGRPKGSGKFGCETRVIRVPAHMADEIMGFIKKKLKAEK